MLKEFVPQSNLAKLRLQQFSNLENIRHAAEFFKLRQWSQDTIRINARGNLEVCLDEAHHIDLLTLVENFKQQGHHTPMILRFPALITKQLARIENSFYDAICQTGYTNGYTLAYPVKVNPHLGILDTLLNLRHNGSVGFEVGSKAEFLLVLARASKQHLILANGFKDIPYLKLALAAAADGQNICIVIETLEEANDIVKLCATTKLAAKLGVRVRLNNVSTGKWQDSNGQYSKFGLTSNELNQALQLLQQHQLLAAINTLHIHPGSQITALSDIILCSQECVRYYHEILKLGVDIEYLDVGGGLAVDYAPTGQNHYKNYSIEQYAMAIVEQLGSYCRKHNLPCPHIISESGRALMALSSLMITDVVPLKQANTLNHPPPSDDEPTIIQQLWKFYLSIPTYNNKAHLYHAESQLEQLLITVKADFNGSLLNLAQLAIAENLYDASLQLISNQLKLITNNKANTEYQQYKYLANFSLFQNIPDHWGIQQFFPLLSLHGYNQPLTESAVFYDLTCDSYGVIREYLHSQKLQHTLRLPAVNKLKFIAIFLVGAYQEVLASKHNLLERPLIIDVTIDDQHNVVTRPYHFCDMQQSFEALGYQPDALLADVTNKFEAKLQQEIIKQLNCSSYLQEQA